MGIQADPCSPQTLMAMEQQSQQPAGGALKRWALPVMLSSLFALLRR